MKLSKSSLLILISYLIIFLLPSLIMLFVNLGVGIIWVQTLDYLLGAALLGWLNYKTNETNLIDRPETNISKSIKWGLIGLVLVYVLQIVISYITFMMGHNPSSENTATLMTIAKANPFFVLSIAIGAPIMEELVFRKVLFGNLASLLNIEEKYAILVAAIISSFIFALMHSDGHIILYASIGLLFCWLYKKTGKIYTSMISHILMNSIIILPVLFS